MPSAVSPNPRAASPIGDKYDNPFNYDDVVTDFLKDLPLDKDSSNNNSNNAPLDTSKNIDEEITVKKKRKPVPKLDETLLLSDKGLPKLRKITKSRLKFRGKGHEFSDMSMLLDTYQLWLDELYPRAKFRDALSMVEKVGHSKGMQVRRRAWLDDTKPRARESSPEKEDDVAMSGALPTGDSQDGRREDSQAKANSKGPDDADLVHHADKTREVDEPDDAPEDDELDALMAEDTSRSVTQAPSARQKKGPFEEDEEEMEDDDLDALLAEQSAIDGAAVGAARTDPHVEAARHNGNMDDFADEEEAMAGMDMW